MYDIENKILIEYQIQKLWRRKYGLKDTFTSRMFILQSHYPNRRSADSRWAISWKIGRRRSIVSRRRQRLWLNCWSADDFFCRSTQVKSFFDWSPDFHGFCHRWRVGRWSPDDRLTIGRRFEEIYIMISAEDRPIIGRQSADDRQTISRWGYIKDSSADRRRYRPFLGRWSPACRSIIKCGLCYILIMHVLHYVYN